MDSQINWTALYRQGRCKAVGIPWNDEEQEALRNGISVDDIRKGILKKEDKSKVEKNLTKLERLKKEELIELAKEKGISFDENVVTRGDLILELKKK